MIAEALRRLRLVRAEPARATEPIENVVVGDKLVASALSGCTWTVIHEHDSEGRRMLSLRWRNALILRDEAELRENNEGWRRA